MRGVRVDRGEQQMCKRREGQGRELEGQERGKQEGSKG